MRKAYKCRAYPTIEQASLLNRTFGCVRLVWNRTLRERQRDYATEGKSTSYAEASKHLTRMKADPVFAFLREVPSVPLQQVLRHQQNAFSAFFAKRARYPRFKSRNRRQSAEFTRSAFRMKDGDLWLAKTTDPLPFVWSWPDVDPADIDPATVTVSRDPDGRWFVSFAIESADPAPLPPTGSTVGVDVGLKDFAVLSTGERIAHPKHMERRERNLKRYQRRMARCQKGSKNRAKANRKVARAHSKVRDARRDFLHQTSTRIVAGHDRVAVEDLAVSNMVRNRRLSKAVSRSGWAEFRSMLEYKAARAGRELVVIDRWYPSSKTCSECGHLLASLSLGTRRWTCPDCGTRHDRDLNAAKNIDNAAGLVVSASGEDVRRHRATDPLSPAKEEPQRATVGIPRL